MSVSKRGIGTTVWLHGQELDGEYLVHTTRSASYEGQAVVALGIYAYCKASDVNI
ncbi:hypothetical protein COCC4DRAFT_33976 [Bipolaris maydis ATCC 48331]|uniref:Uncharacterized protein n=2 Tax=Cochliobolus heterostrophus TaxID=5016 RepID=M2UVC0_COCH5|nr:uncharacterized protein COCC4DRAFT_33976 [Bipolaris maydis ATCC 48331]EMD97516.1 hypothetical protein COCHEDRAFT_1018971 [Bipolaris maydis C5]ENI01346.1 hypothetical protein COCC4DRAFT_33976 [Bipolaris maydis ATCC 48331]